jgi:hypothetical protein
MDPVEIMKMILAAAAGGGAWQIATWKLSRKKLRGDTAAGQYRQMEDIIDSYIAKMSDLSDKIVALKLENIQLRKEIIAQEKQRHDATDDTATEDSHARRDVE